MNRLPLALLFACLFLFMGGQKVLGQHKTKLQNLGPAINTAYDESAPVISPDGQSLFFWSLDRPGGFGFQDIYVSKRDTNGAWLPAKNIGPTLNDAEVNIVLSITPDGQRLLIYNKKEKHTKHGKGKAPAPKDTTKLTEAAKKAPLSDLALVRKVYDSWGNGSQMKVENYVNKGSASLTAYLAADGKTLILSMEGPDTRGQEDLYISRWNNASHTWSEPKNLGDYINSTSAEITPFLAPDGITLYYSSDGGAGLGGQDVYMTQRLDSTWRNWSPPVNLGNDINSEGDDYHFKFDATADSAYMISTVSPDTSYGGKDIFRVKIPEKSKPKPVVLVRGKVLNQKNNTPMEAFITYMILPEGIEVGSAHSDATTGEYTIILPAGQNYLVMAEGEGFVSVSENLDTRKTTESFEVIERDLFMAPVQAGEVVLLNNLFYETSKYKLQDASTPELHRLLLVMQNYANMKIEIAGHTDNTGDENFNRQLSENRAKAVVEYLVKNGVPENRVYAKGYGSKQPKADNKTKEGRQLNRRVEFKIISM